jgi:hypothetical protein
MLAAAVFSVVYRPARQGRKVAYLTVASFLFLAAVLAYQLMASSLHGVKTGRGAAASQIRLQLRPGARMEPLSVQSDKEPRRQGDKGMQNLASASLPVSLSPCPLVSFLFVPVPHQNGGGA